MHVAQSLGAAAPPIVDGGPCMAGLESTIVALREDSWELLRPGPVTRDELEALLGAEQKSRGATIEAPGQLARHYSPGKPVELDCTRRDAEAFLIGFGEAEGDANLSPSGDLAEAAARLYAVLHEAAASARPRIAVAPIPSTGMGQAINDRLRRAAS